MNKTDLINAVAEKAELTKADAGRALEAFFETVQKALQDQLREAIAYPGFSVVIAKHPCMLKFLREKSRKLAARQMQTANR